MGGTFWQRLLRGSWQVAAGPDWPTCAGAGWADQVMNVQLQDRFHAKDGRSTARWVLEGPAGKLVVYLKRHYVLSRFRGLLATLFPRVGWSPAMQEGRNLALAAG